MGKWKISKVGFLIWNVVGEDTDVNGRRKNIVDEAAGLRLVEAEAPPAVAAEAAAKVRNREAVAAAEVRARIRNLVIARTLVPVGAGRMIVVVVVGTEMVQAVAEPSADTLPIATRAGKVRTMILDNRVVKISFIFYDTLHSIECQSFW
jgi:hypothetical protein